MPGDRLLTTFVLYPLREKKIATFPQLLNLEFINSNVHLYLTHTVYFLYGSKCSDKVNIYGVLEQHQKVCVGEVIIMQRNEFLKLLLLVLLEFKVKTTKSSSEPCVTALNTIVHFRLPF